jgi:hypothetical protein
MVQSPPCGAGARGAPCCRVGRCEHVVRGLFDDPHLTFARREPLGRRLAASAVIDRLIDCSAIRATCVLHVTGLLLRVRGAAVEPLAQRITA